MDAHAVSARHPDPVRTRLVGTVHAAHGRALDAARARARQVNPDGRAGADHLDALERRTVGQHLDHRAIRTPGRANRDAEPAAVHDHVAGGDAGRLLVLAGGHEDAGALGRVRERLADGPKRRLGRRPVAGDRDRAIDVDGHGDRRRRLASIAGVEVRVAPPILAADDQATPGDLQLEGGAAHHRLEAVFR